jgi:EAL domain-containing protein (putative c-di-GMP-specific phosphodiesterase class I)
LVSQSEKIKSDLEAIRALGVRIALDDFGTSYSSMFFLRDFKLDRIKLDRNFVSNMRHEKDGVEIINNMIGLGSTFSDRLTVEGIETIEQQKIMQQSGVNDLQGFLFSKPLSISELQNSKMVTELVKCSANEDDTSNIKTLPINRLAG